MTELNDENQGRVGQVADAPGNWVDRWIPASVQPFLRLARLDRPIGTWLLLWPCLWSLTLAAGQTGNFPSIWLMMVFGIGALVMRGAGCTFNDLVDRELDAGVARTASRPLPSGAVSVRAAWVFLIVQCLIGLAILFMFNEFAIAVGLSSALLVAVYPFMKRITYWPQLFLGLTFNWGALLGWTVVTGTFTPDSLNAVSWQILWTIGYDTIYAHQDKEDDALIGVKSSALRLGHHTKAALYLLYGGALSLFALAGQTAGLGWGFWIMLPLGAAHLIWQIRRTGIDDPESCLLVFRSNRDFGALMFLAFVADALVDLQWP